MAISSMRKRSFVKALESTGPGLLLGYARVSRGDEQNNALQTRALEAAGCRRLFEEAASGGRWDRPELHRTGAGCSHTVVKTGYPSKPVGSCPRGGSFGSWCVRE